MNIYIHKNALGFQHHLVLDENKRILKTKEIPDQEVLVFGDPGFLEIAKIHSRSMPPFPSEAHQKAMRAVLGDFDMSAVPWTQVLPKAAFKRSVEALATQLWNEFSGINLDYYKTYYKKTCSMLEWFEPAKIDPRAWMVHNNDPNLVTPHVLRSFEPDSTWFANKVVYSKSDTKTGRLKVIEGPNILHLPKEQRNIICSRFGPEGKIMQLDFRALEPRVVLFINLLSSLPGNVPLLGSGAVAEDIYQDVLATLGITDISRDKVKDVILSQLYGAGYEKILVGLDEIRDPDGFISAVNEIFGLDDLKEKLLREYEENNREFIESFYGRFLNTKDAKPYMLLNYFTQSTAVDAALNGFKNFLRAVRGNPGIIPLFLIHDALVLDVRLDQMKLLFQLKSLCSKEIPKFPGCEFPVKVSRF